MSRVVDAQIHIWQDESENAPWPPEWRTYAHRGGSSPSAEDLIREMDQVGVDRAILVPPSFAGDDNEPALAAAARYPDRFGVMGRVSLLDGSASDVAQLSREASVLGIRVSFTRRASNWLRDGTADWFWPAAEAAKLPVAVYAPGQIPAVEEILTSHPGLRVIVDHVALPTSGGPAEVLSDVVRQVTELSSFPNCAVKLTALPCSAHGFEPFPYPTAQRWMRELVAAFGASRVFWGTDLTRLPCPYAEALGFVAEAPFIDGEDLRQVLGEGLIDWLGWSEESNETAR